MSATPPNLGVAAPSGTPPPTTPAWPETAQLPTVPPSGLLSPVAATWPRPALWATVLLLFVAFALLAWNVCASSRWTARPTTLEPAAWRTARLDLNRADRVQLLQLPGVGETTAARIEAYRDDHNGFRSVDELRQVHGVGPALLEKLRPLVYVEPLDSTEESEGRDDPPEEPHRPPPPPAMKTSPQKPALTKKGSELTAPIDVNRASAEELQRLPGIGPTLSERIIVTRKQGAFKKVDDLRRVSGIGKKTLDKLRPLVTVGDTDSEKKD